MHLQIVGARTCLLVSQDTSSIRWKASRAEGTHVLNRRGRKRALARREMVLSPTKDGRRGRGRGRKEFPRTVPACDEGRQRS
jgi:hypothetical protein